MRRATSSRRKAGAGGWSRTAIDMASPRRENLRHSAGQDGRLVVEQRDDLGAEPLDALEEVVEGQHDSDVRVGLGERVEVGRDGLRRADDGPRLDGLAPGVELA